MSEEIWYSSPSTCRPAGWLRPCPGTGSRGRGSRCRPRTSASASPGPAASAPCSGRPLPRSSCPTAGIERLEAELALRVGLVVVEQVAHVAAGVGQLGRQVLGDVRLDRQVVGQVARRCPWRPATACRRGSRSGRGGRTRASPIRLTATTAPMTSSTKVVAFDAESRLRRFIAAAWRRCLSGLQLPWLLPPPRFEGERRDQQADAHHREVVDDVAGVDDAAADVLEVAVDAEERRPAAAAPAGTNWVSAPEQEEREARWRRRR